MKEIVIGVDQNSQENNADVVVVQGEVFTFKATGLTRRVFANADKTKVVKIPVKTSYQHFNDQEMEIYDEADDEKRAKLAETSMLENGYIMQEYLHSLDDPETEDWLGRDMTMDEVRFATSCKEDVGYDKDGNLKCFDLHEYYAY